MYLCVSIRISKNSNNSARTLVQDWLFRYLLVYNSYSVHRTVCAAGAAVWQGEGYLKTSRRDGLTSCYSSWGSQAAAWQHWHLIPSVPDRAQSVNQRWGEGCGGGGEGGGVNWRPTVREQKGSGLVETRDKETKWIVCLHRWDTVSVRVGGGQNSTKGAGDGGKRQRLWTDGAVITGVQIVEGGAQHYTNSLQLSNL